MSYFVLKEFFLICPVHFDSNSKGISGFGNLCVQCCFWNCSYILPNGRGRELSTFEETTILSSATALSLWLVCGFGRPAVIATFLSVCWCPVLFYCVSCIKIFLTLSSGVIIKKKFVGTWLYSLNSVLDWKCTLSVLVGRWRAAAIAKPATTWCASQRWQGPQCGRGDC